MANIIIIVVLFIIIGTAVCYIIKAKKRGVKCIGCPAADSCPSRNMGNAGDGCGCQSDTGDKNRNDKLNMNIKDAI